MDTERLGHRIVDVPVEWREDADSRVRVVATAWGDLKGLLRIALASARWAGLICLKLEIFFEHEEHESHEEIDPLQLRAKRLGAL